MPPTSQTPMPKQGGVSAIVLCNAEIADRLAGLAQLLSAQKENSYKVRAYQRAAANIRSMGESVEELVHEEADLTQYPGIGDAMAAAIREIVQTGTLRKLETLRSEVGAEIASLGSFPRLDPKLARRAYKKLNISSVDELRERLESGELEEKLGRRVTEHVRRAMFESRAMLLYRADTLATNIEEYLLTRCGARRVEVAGDYRRRKETIEELSFVVETNDADALIIALQRYGGRTLLISRRKRHGEHEAVFELSAGIALHIQTATPGRWGFQLCVCTGSSEHLRSLVAASGGLRIFEARGSQLADENEVYSRAGLQFVPPELREGGNEVSLAAENAIPELIQVQQLRGELHAHTTSSDGTYSIEEMAKSARARGYEYIGITDHSQSLKIARGVSVDDLWKQIRHIDKLNARATDNFVILKSAEVDILADGSIDYPDDLLRELDYTVCSIHSRFGLNKAAQTERVLRAMDNPYFTILGHATGRLLLKRSGYELDIERIVEHAKARGCFFEINSSPDRLDLSAENARKAAERGVKIAITTDAHSIRDFGYARYGVDQARRAGLTVADVLNAVPVLDLRKQFSRLCSLR